MKEPEIISRNKAKAMGLVKFYTGQPCKVCGEKSYNYVGNLSCQNCNKHEMARRYREAKKLTDAGKEPKVPPKERRPTIPGARFIAGRCQSGSKDSDYDVAN